MAEGRAMAVLVDGLDTFSACGRLLETGRVVRGVARDLTRIRAAGAGFLLAPTFFVAAFTLGALGLALSRTLGSATFLPDPRFACSFTTLRTTFILIFLGSQMLLKSEPLFVW